jgi:hypothetical protein
MYRVLATSDHRVGMYTLIRAGARSDSEFFPESFHREAFASEAVYARFLQQRGVDIVIAVDEYDARYRSNETKLLNALADSGGRCVDGVRVARGDGAKTTLRVFVVDRHCVQAAS